VVSFLLVALGLAIYSRRPKNPLKRKYPTAEEPLLNYVTDFENLWLSLDGARTMRQLDYGKKFIAMFREKYAPHKDQAKLKIDVNTLRKLYKERRQSLSLRKQLFNEDFYC
jgi:hypothetical protein